jgi:hypothetical protein
MRERVCAAAPRCHHDQELVRVDGLHEVHVEPARSAAVRASVRGTR